MVPSHDNPLDKVPRAKACPTLTYGHGEKERFSEHDPCGSRITGRIDGQEAIEQAVRHVLMTERHDYAIYPPWYGVELQKYHKRDFGYFRATIHQTLHDALTADDRIKNIKVLQAGKLDADAAFVNFEVHTDIGRMAFRAEVGI